MTSTQWVKQKKYLNQEDYQQISELQRECIDADGVALKLELDYKLAVTETDQDKYDNNEINEFMFFDEQKLIGYIGIGSFGGTGMPLEITGMVHPAYRNQGIFTALHKLVMNECRSRNAREVLLLCDKKSISGQGLIQKLDTEYDHSEYEMYLLGDAPVIVEDLLCGIKLCKATNSDAFEIARQNAIYFEDPLPNEEEIMALLGKINSGEELELEDTLLPEVEEKRGMQIYLAYKDDKIVGKIHLETNSQVSGIYGLGVLPEYRGKGYGRAILLKGIKIMKESGIKNIMLQVEAENSTALGLYTSCGFVETSTMDYVRLIKG